MKKLLVVVTLLSASLMLQAQTPGEGAPARGNRRKMDPEKMAQRAAQKMSEELLLNDDVAASFIPVYKQFLVDQKAIMDKYRPSRPSAPKEGAPEADKSQQGRPQSRSDANIEAEIKAGFAKSQEILDLRVAYYDKFREVLTARQIKQMYRAEKQDAIEAREHFQDGPRGQMPPQGGPRGGFPGGPMD